jgi:integrase
MPQEVHRLPGLPAKLRESKLGVAFAAWIEKMWRSLIRNPNCSRRKGRVAPWKNRRQRKNRRHPRGIRPNWRPDLSNWQGLQNSRPHSGWLPNIQKSTEGPVRLRRSQIRVTKAHGIAAMPDITVELVDRYREARPIRSSTWVKERELLVVFFNFAIARKWIEENPAAAVKAPKIKPTEKEPYTPADISRFLAATEKLGRTAYERLRALALLLLLRYTAMRISDVALLERSRVRDGQIFVRATKNGKPIFLPAAHDLA